MSIDNRRGTEITPLVMTICGALWAVLFSLIAWNLHETVEMAKTLNAVPAIQHEVDDHETRIRALERKP